ncbi:hypothetical protein RYX36_004073 [Vicia faba]
MDRDTITLNSIMEMCIRCDYLVTTCYNASFALNFLKKIKNLYDVILIEAQMPDMNSYHFLQHVTQQIKIPVIMMCVDQSITPSLMMKAIEKGACGYWIKPLSEGKINNIWQHVVRKVLKENNQHDQVFEILNVKDLKKREKDDYAPTSSCDDNINYQPSTKRSHFSWSQKLNKKILMRCESTWHSRSKGKKKVMKLMNVPGLTIQQIASHLQKFKLRLKRETEENKKPKVGKKKIKMGW